MNIALFDLVVAPHTGPGACDVDVLEALRDDHELTVFASELTVPGGAGRTVRHVAVPTVHHPALAAFLVYLVRSCVSYSGLRLRGRRFDVVQSTDCSFPAADVCYLHLCHRAFLTEVWPHVQARITPRTVHSWANHAVRALIESRLVRRARVIVVPSEGLKRDLTRVYPGVADRVTVIRNFVDLAHYVPPSDFDPGRVRERMGTAEADTAFVFVALGHFERKGLPMLFEALSADEPALEHARVWVVGGEPGLVASFRKAADQLGVAGKVSFAGRTDDVRPFLWSADAFIAPSHYEAFSLALLEAAAAGLPLIATRISGSEELLQDGRNGLALERTPSGVRAGLRRFMQLDAVDRRAMGHAARGSVDALGADHFADAWRKLYASLAGPDFS